MKRWGGWPPRVRCMGFNWRETDVAAFSVRPVAARLTAPALRPSRESVRGFALASVIANAVLICTGAAVRLSSSGLGCPDWPRCTKTSVVAAQSAGQTSLNTAIEFGSGIVVLTRLNPVAVQAAPASTAGNPQAPGRNPGAEGGIH